MALKSEESSPFANLVIIVELRKILCSFDGLMCRLLAYFADRGVNCRYFCCAPTIGYVTHYPWIKIKTILFSYIVVDLNLDAN